MKVGLFNNIQASNLSLSAKDSNFVWKKEKDSFVKSKPTFKGITDNIPKKAKVESKAFDYDEENVKKNRAFLEEIKDKNSPYHNFKIDKALFEKIIYADIKDLLSIVRQYGNFCLHYAPERIHLYIDYDEETNTYSIEEANLNEKEKQIFVNTSTDKQLQNLMDGLGELDTSEYDKGFENENLTKDIRRALESDMAEDRAAIDRTMQVLQMNKIKTVKDFKKIHAEYEPYRDSKIGRLAFLVMRSELDPKYTKEFIEAFNEGFMPENTVEENIEALQYYQKLLKTFKITTKEQFAEKFAALGSDFDDFEESEDIFNAIYFLADNLMDGATYERYLNEYSSDTMTFGEFIDSRDCDEKVEDLNFILSNFELGKKNRTGEIVYQNYREIIDYWWETNNGNLFGFEKYLGKILEFEGKIITIPTRLIDKNQQNQASKTNINFAKSDSKISTKDKIELLKTLIKYDLEPSVFQKLTEKNLQDVEFKTYLENLDVIPDEISDATGVQEEQAKSKYISCKNIYAALGDSELGLSVKDIAKFIAKFKIENDESLNAIGKNIENGFKKIEKKEDIVRLYKLLAYSNIKNAEELAEFDAECKKTKRRPTEQIKLNEKRYQDFVKDFNKYKAENKDNPEADDFLKNADELYVWQNYFKMFGEIRNMTTSQILEYITEENLLSDEDYFAIPAQLRNSKDSAYSTFNAINSYLKNTNNKQIKEFFAGQSGEEITEKYSEILSAELHGNNNPAQISKALIFISNFEIKDNEDFKNKFKNTQSKDDIRNLISTLAKANINSLEDYRLVEKHATGIPEIKYIKNNKLVQFAKELSIFKSENPDFADKLAKNNITTPTKLYFEFPELFKYFDEAGANSSFKRAFDFLEKSNIANLTEYEEKLEPFYEYLETEEQVIKYISATGMDFSKESYAKTCLGALKAIHNKNIPEVTFKKAEKFARNFLAQATKNEGKNKTPYDILKESFIKSGDIENTRKFINFLDKRKIASIESFNLQMEEFKDENGSASSAIALFKKLPDELTLEKFSTNLKVLKKAVERFTKETGIITPALENLDYKELSEEDLELDFANKDNVYKIIKKLTHGKVDKSILTSFINCYTNEEKISILKSVVAKELVRVERMGYEPYDNIKKALKLRKEDLGLEDNASEEEYREAIYANIPQEFMDFINSDAFSKGVRYGRKVPKISNHAKLRLIDRFILKKGKDASYLYSKEAKEEIKEILKAVYDNEPEEIKLLASEKTAGKNKETSKENAYKILFDYNLEPCYAVFSETGLMETIFYEDEMQYRA
ncbi:hypothetical protein IJC60_04905 [bacterium]|nr:hypothetical protein [bacterium]